jgi:hypothetical protein
MGDAAEMVLEGVVCESCGEFIGPAVGHTRDCDDCRKAMGEDVSDQDEFGEED